MKRIAYVLAVAVAAAAAGSAIAGQTPGVLPPQSHPYGADYGEWQARWQQWTLGLPVTDHPGLDPTGEDCGVAQSGPVWFLSFVTDLGTTHRVCRMPSGKAVLVLVASTECSNIEPPPFFGDSEAELRECARTSFDSFFSGPMSVTVDGVPVADLSSYRTQTGVFSYTLPADNLYGLPAGTTATKALSDGIFLMLAPLSVGEHEVAIHIEIPGLGVVDEIYTLNVVPAGRY